jgi:hypothetical protein
MAGLEQRAKDATDELRGISSQSVLAAQHGLILTLADQIQRLGLVVEGSQQQHAAVVKIHNNLHRSLKAHKALQYKGVFNPGATYEHGNFVSPRAVSGTAMPPPRPISLARTTPIGRLP